MHWLMIFFCSVTTETHVTSSTVDVIRRILNLFLDHCHGGCWSHWSWIFRSFFWGLRIRRVEALEWIERVNGGRNVRVKEWKKAFQTNRSRNGWGHCSILIYQKIDFKSKLVRKWIWRDDTKVKNVHCSWGLEFSFQDTCHMAQLTTICNSSFTRSNTFFWQTHLHRIKNYSSLFKISPKNIQRKQSIKGKIQI